MPAANLNQDDAGQSVPLQSRCAFCHITKETLFRCRGCLLVKYCCRGHRATHRNKHKSACKQTRKLKAQLKNEELFLRNAPLDILALPNGFTINVRSFWSLVYVPPYMDARRAVAEHAVRMGTLEGVLEGLGHFKDMIRLNCTHNMGIHNKVPALMLRLDRDQQCYDFIKWWESTQEGHYDFESLAIPFPNATDADVLELPPTYLVKKHANVNFQVAVLLLKIKMLIDIRQLKITRKILQRRLPVELWDGVEKEAIRSPLSSRFLRKT